MTRLLNFTRRSYGVFIFLLVSSAIGLALVFARVLGALRATPLHTAAGGLLLSTVLCMAVSRVRTVIWRDMMCAVLESERTGKFMPNFPVNSPLSDMNRLSAALNGAANSILHSQADLDRAYLQFVETMAQALDARDPYTAGHSLRVASYSYTLARELGLSEADAETIRIAAQLHDIGKIGIPDAVLQKPGLLTPEEYGLIKLHPQIGRRILERVGRFEQLLNVVELHHENHDGTGYPYGLAGDSVPIDARIVHVADSFDAMTTTRSYRSALPLRAAIQEIERNAGRMFDPAAAMAFVKLIAEGQVEICSQNITTELGSAVNLRILEKIAV